MWLSKTGRKCVRLKMGLVVKAVENGAGNQKKKHYPRGKNASMLSKTGPRNRKCVMVIERGEKGVVVVEKAPYE